MLEADLAGLLRAVEASMRAGDMAGAMAWAGKAAALGADRPQVLVLASYDCLERGDPAKALDYAGKARAANRRDPETLNAYALSLNASGRHGEALAAFDEALRLAPGHPRFFYGKGCVYEEMGDNVRARAAFERAIAANPQDARALSRLAFLAVQRGDFAEARRYGEQTNRLLPGEPCAALALASADVHEKNFAAALPRLEPFAKQPPNINRAIAEGLSGDALDGLGRYREAFRAYAECNAMLRSLYRGDTGAAGAVGKLISYFRDAPAEIWRARKTGASARTHVFLVGFPRSGTTLLEQALAAHPDIESMEEVPCLWGAEDAYLDNLDSLAAAPSEALEKFRKDYWRRVKESGQPLKTKVFVDKLPLNAVVLCLVAKLFPGAKILFALRDPADVVWSGFRRRFVLSPQMFELTDLAGAARYYDRVMTLAMLYRDKLGLDWHEVVYEKLVAGFEGEMRKVCDFLGVPYSDAMTGFAEVSRKRAPNTPSAPQIAKGLYTGAAGQWTAYRDELQPILPILAPWRARFGYEELNHAP